MGFWGSISGVAEKATASDGAERNACSLFGFYFLAAVLGDWFPRHQAFPSLTKWRQAGRGGTDTGGIHPLRPCERGWLLTLSRWGLRGLESVIVLFCLLFAFETTSHPVTQVDLGLQQSSCFILQTAAITGVRDHACLFDSFCHPLPQVIHLEIDEGWSSCTVHSRFGASSPEPRLSLHMAPLLAFYRVLPLGL